MGTGYTRNDTANNIADGNVINAADFDGEYDAIEAAFNSSTGHTHDGTAAEGGPITVLGPSQEFVASASSVAPSTNAGLDLGTASLKFKDLYIDGTAYIDGLGGNLLIDTTNALQFRDTALSISSSADGQLDVAADVTAKITSPEVIVTDDFRLQSDAAILTFGADDDVTVTHVADTGLDAKAAAGFALKLQTGDTTVEAGNTLGKISFNAPDEASGTDAILVGAEIEAAAEDTFSSTVNSTALVFKTNDSAAATERMRIKSNGDIVIKGASYDVTWDASADAFITDSNNDIKFQPHGTGSVAITGALDVDNINIDGNSIISTDTNGDINITPNGTGQVILGGGFVPSQISLTSTDGGAAKGPQLDIFRNSATPADGDAIGYIDFSGDDSGNNKTVYASILAEATDVTDTTEDGTLKFNTMVAGTDTTTMTITESKVGIGTSSPSAKLQLLGSGAINGHDVGIYTYESGANTSSPYLLLGNEQGAALRGVNTGTNGRKALVFYTSNNTGAGTGVFTPTERMRIDSSGTMIHKGAATFNEDGADADFRVESDTNTHMLFVDAGNNRIGMGTSAPDKNLHIAGTSGGSANIILQRTATGLSTQSRATVEAYNNSGYSMGGISFNAAGDDNSGELDFYVTADNSSDSSIFDLQRTANFQSSEVVFNEDSYDQDFRVESDANTNMFKIDAGNNRAFFGSGGFTTGLVGMDYNLDTSADWYSDSKAVLMLKNSNANGNVSLKMNNQGTNSSFIVHNTSGNEGFHIYDRTITGKRFSADSTETVINEDSKNLDFRVESDARTHIFYVDAGNDSVNINDTSTDYMLSINRTSDSNKGLYRNRRDRASRIHVFNGSPSGSTRTVTVEFGDFGLTGALVTVDISGHKYNNGNAFFYIRKVFAIMEESSATRINSDRSSTLGFTLGNETGRVGTVSCSFPDGGKTQVTFTVHGEWDTKVFAQIEGAGASSVNSISVS